MVSARDFGADWLQDDDYDEVGGRQRMAKPQLRQKSSSEKFATTARYRRRSGAWKAGGMHRRSGRSAVKAG